jgi:hypothetical protein
MACFYDILEAVFICLWLFWTALKKIQLSFLVMLVRNRILGFMQTEGGIQIYLPDKSLVVIVKRIK